MENKEKDQQGNLLELRSDIKVIGDYLKEISNEVIELGISEHPIFVAHREDNVQLGKPIIKREQSKTNWSYNASVMEEFVKKGFLKEENLDQFKMVYKDSSRFVCFFIVDPKQMEFVWAPYDLDADLK